MEQWRGIPDFPGYSVSDEGRVRNDDTGRILLVQVNQTGVPNVGLVRRPYLHEGSLSVQKKRSVALLVASAFLGPHPEESFDTPINLNGDRLDNRVSNLMWRPRWFAVRYFDQFKTPKRWGINNPLEDRKTGERYEDSRDAAIKNGLLEQDIYLAALNNTYVWPTYQTFRVVPVDQYVS